MIVMKAYRTTDYTSMIPSYFFNHSMVPIPAMMEEESSTAWIEKNSC
jgi:hypothetical protein